MTKFSVTVTKNKRIDSEYYRAEILENISLLEKNRGDLLGNIASFVVGPFGSTVTIDQYVDKSNFRYIRNKDINNFLVNDDNPALIPEKIYENLPQFHIKELDLLITVVGTLGKVAIAQINDSKSIFSCKCTLIRTNKIDPYYLLTYLNSKIGQIFVLRGVRGAIQQGLNLSDLKEIKVYLASIGFQKSIREVVLSAFRAINESKSLYSQAEQILLSELDLLDWKPKHQLAFVKNFSDTRAADRIDAEYYQPKYEEIIRAIQSTENRQSLGDLVSINKCVEPGSNAYQEKGIPFLRVSNLSKFGFKDGNQQFLSEEAYQELYKHQPKQGEILLSKDATPGIAYYLNENPHEMIPSGGILRLTVNDVKKLYPEYLTLVLNSVIVQKQIERDAGGSIINHWLVDQVKNTLIPILSPEKQKKIAEIINESFNKRKLSKQLLDVAKRGVEMAIEKDETQAQKWIDEKLQEMNIALQTAD